MSDNSKNKIYKGIGLIAGIIIIICCITLNIFTKNSLYNGKIANNIFIQGIDVSNMTKSCLLYTSYNAYKLIYYKY